MCQQNIYSNCRRRKLTSMNAAWGNTSGYGYERTLKIRCAYTEENKIITIKVKNLIHP